MILKKYPLIDSWLQELSTSNLAQSLTVVATAGGDTPEAKVAIAAALLLIVSYPFGIPFIEFDCAHPQLVRQPRQQHREIHISGVSRTVVLLFLVLILYQ
jgi:hypothetical protein